MHVPHPAPPKGASPALYFAALAVSWLGVVSCREAAILQLYLDNFISLVSFWHQARNEANLLALGLLYKSVDIILVTGLLPISSCYTMMELNFTHRRPFSSTMEEGRIRQDDLDGLWSYNYTGFHQLFSICFFNGLGWASTSCEVNSIAAALYMSDTRFAKREAELHLVCGLCIPKNRSRDAVNLSL